MTKTTLISDTFTILLVEDSDDNVMLVRAFLRNSPYSLRVARNGQEGVAMAQNGDCDLVLMDVQMPVMDGYSATTAIRTWEAANQRQPMPVIALTAHTFEEDVQKALDAGCNLYLLKPISKAKLLEVLAQHCVARQPPAIMDT